MSASLKYGTAATFLLGGVTLLLWPFLEPAGRAGVVAAAGVALPVQVIAFAMLVRYRGREAGFMAAWVGGMAVRALVVIAVAFVVIRSGTSSAVPMLLALVGFFFALLLLEPVYFRREPETA